MDKKNTVYAIRILWSFLGIRRRKQVILLLGLIVAGAVMEMISLGAIIPFLGILLDPSKVLSTTIVRQALNDLDLAAYIDLTLFFTLIFILASITACAVRLALLRYSTKIAYAIGADLSAKVFERTLYQPYQAHIERNSSELISIILHKVDGAVGVLYMTITLLSSSIILAALLALMIFMSPNIAMILIVVFAVIYAMISLYFKSRLEKNSLIVSRSSTQLLKTLQESFGGIRDVILDGTQAFFLKVYRGADLPLRRVMGENIFIAGSPRFVMEMLGMVLLSVLAYVLVHESSGSVAPLPFLGVLALGAQKLLPVLQQGFNAWVSIVSNKRSFYDVLEILEQPLCIAEHLGSDSTFEFKKAIVFDRVSFRYKDNAPLILSEVNLELEKGAKIGIVGSTGSGKSTLVDILMGLLPPSTGGILVDQKLLDESQYSSWQNLIAHVPQAIYLADASIAENIAFGIPKDRIDMDRVRQSARKASISQFIEGHPHGYDMSVGERGVKLSGGQRQRIGIARALYKNAKILVFDEATSALDGVTENEVMEAILSLDKDLTLIIIAHRLSTLRGCDIIIELESGKVKSKGTFDSLLKDSPTFKKMAGFNGQ
jgi:ATP-binding cassette subfamily B protein